LPPNEESREFSNGEQAETILVFGSGFVYVFYRDLTCCESAFSPLRRHYALAIRLILVAVEEMTRLMYARESR
jgi:hypothetical protein